MGIYMKNLYKFKINYNLQYGASRGNSLENVIDIKKFLILVNEAEYIHNYGILYKDFMEVDDYYEMYSGGALRNNFYDEESDLSELIKNYSLPMILKGDELNILPNNILNIQLFREHLSDLPYLP